MSVWESSVDALRNNVYRSAHSGVLRRRQERLAALRADGPKP
jgi:uncharacterized protein DUF3291